MEASILTLNVDMVLFYMRLMTSVFFTWIHHHIKDEGSIYFNPDVYKTFSIALRKRASERTDNRHHHP